MFEGVAMGDFQEMVRSLKEARRLERERKATWRGIAIEVAIWVVVLGGLFVILKWLVPHV